LLGLSPVTSSFEHFRTVQNHAFTSLSPENKRRSNLHQLFSSINTNNSNNNIHLNEFSSSSSARQRLSRTPIQDSSENHHPIHFSRPKSAVPSSMSENSAFHIVHNPNSIHTNIQHHQQQQYITLLKILKAQEIEVEQQEKRLNEKHEGKTQTKNSFILFLFFYRN
jgi:hypothetical protein